MTVDWESLYVQPFVQRSDELRHGWHVVRPENRPYDCYLRKMHVLDVGQGAAVASVPLKYGEPIGNNGQQEDDIPEMAMEMEMEMAEDPATCTRFSDADTRTATPALLEAHVIFSRSYRVPVLYVQLVSVAEGQPWRARETLQLLESVFPRSLIWSPEVGFDRYPRRLTHSHTHTLCIAYPSFVSSRNTRISVLLISSYTRAIRAHFCNSYRRRRRCRRRRRHHHSYSPRGSLLWAATGSWIGDTLWITLDPLKLTTFSDSTTAPSPFAVCLRELSALRVGSLGSSLVVSELRRFERITPWLGMT